MAGDTQKPNILQVLSFTGSVAAMGLSAAALMVAMDRPAPVPVGQPLALPGVGTPSVAISPDALRKTLVENPDVMVSAIKAFQAHQASEQLKQDEAARQASIPAVEALKDKIFLPDDPFIGNPNGKHVIVEIFDYQCPYCRSAEPVLRQIVARDPEAKLIFRDWPIEGPMSVAAARAALAAGLQGKYVPMHDALFRVQMPLTEDKIFAAAKEAGVDAEKLRADMADDAGRVSSELAATKSLVTSHPELGITGTPSFIARGAGVMQGFGNPDRFLRFLAAAKGP